MNLRPTELRRTFARLAKRLTGQDLTCDDMSVIRTAVMPYDAQSQQDMAMGDIPTRLVYFQASRMHGNKWAVASYVGELSFAGYPFLKHKDICSVTGIDAALSKIEQLENKHPFSHFKTDMKDLTYFRNVEKLSRATDTGAPPNPC